MSVLWDMLGSTRHIHASNLMNLEEKERPLRPGSAHLVADTALARRLDWRHLMSLPN